MSRLRSATRRRNRRTIGQDLARVAVAAGLAWLLCAAFFTFDARDEALASERQQAAAAAAAGARGVDGSLTTAAAMATGIAMQPEIGLVGTDRSLCRLDFGSTGMNGRVDITDVDGRVLCSSEEAAVGTTTAAKVLARPGSFVATTDATAGDGFAVAAPFAAEGHAPGGHAVIVVGLDGLGRFVATPQPGRRHTDVEVTTDTTLEREGWMVADASVLPIRVLVALREDAVAADVAERMRSLSWIGGLGLIAVMAVLVIVRRRLAEPVAALHAVVTASGGTAIDAMPDTAAVELSELARGLDALMARRDEVEASLSRQARTDSVTDLPNRIALADHLTDALADLRSEGAPCAVLFVDLDRFRAVNDAWGHEFGDAVLSEVAARLRPLVAPHTVARLGGDEFVVVARLDATAALDLAESVIQGVADAFVVDGRPVRLSATIGVATAASGDDQPTHLIRQADSATLRAKRTGYGSRTLYDPALDEGRAKAIAMEIDLREALGRDQLSVVYQPQTDATTGRTVGVEALVRWNHPERGAVPPSEFIPVAEDAGLIEALGAAVLRQACADAAQWVAAGVAVPVSVNTSARQWASEGFVDDVQRTLRSSGLEPRLLCLEVTESAFVEDDHRAARAIARAREAGIEISIDDFGTGYSSLSYLHRLHVDEVKIDRSFVARLGTDATSDVLVRAVVLIASTLGVRVVAEGVETTAQASALRRLGCGRAQGFLYAMPQSAAEIATRLREERTVVVGGPTRMQLPARTGGATGTP